MSSRPSLAALPDGDLALVEQRKTAATIDGNAAAAASHAQLR